MTDLNTIKRQVSSALLKKVEGVTGVGLPSQGLTVYLEKDTPEIRAEVTKALEPLKLSVPLHWMVTGKFRR